MNPENITPLPSAGNPTVQTSEQKALGNTYKKNGITIRRRHLKDGRWGKWTCVIKFRKKIHVLTLDPRVGVSIDMAVRAKREIQNGRWEELKSAVGLRNRPVATLAQLKIAYFAAPVEASASTRTQNWNALEQVLSIAHPGVNVQTGSSSLICSESATAWFAAAKLRVDTEPDQFRQATLKRSANSRFRQAASVFGTRAMASYKLNKIYHDGFDRFLAAGELYQFVRIPKQQYLPPSEEIIKATFEAWRAITDRNLFLVIGHELAFGLRAGEVVQVKWGWWNVREGYPVLDGTGQFKSGTGRLTVRALDPWFTVMRDRVAAKAWREQDEDFVLTGFPTQREDCVYRAASAWLREQGWTTQKTNHALRAYAGSQVAMRYGIYDAQTWLRHSSVLVTEQHYSYFVKSFKPADVTKLEAHWATASAEFQPIIVAAPGA